MLTAQVTNTCSGAGSSGETLSDPHNSRTQTVLLHQLKENKQIFAAILRAGETYDSVTPVAPGDSRQDSSWRHVLRLTSFLNEVYQLLWFCWAGSVCSQSAGLQGLSWLVLYRSLCTRVNAVEYITSSGSCTVGSCRIWVFWRLCCLLVPFGLLSAGYSQSFSQGPLHWLWTCRLLATHCLVGKPFFSSHTVWGSRIRSGVRKWTSSCVLGCWIHFKITTS